MKIFRLLIICIVLSLFATLSFATSINSYSRGADGNVRFRAGLGISDQVTWNSASQMHFIDENGSEHEYPGQDVDGDSSTPWEMSNDSVSWDVCGRWFVSMNTDKDYLSIVSGATNPYETKTVGNGSGHDLTQMFCNSLWSFQAIGDYEDVYYNGSNWSTFANGYTDPAGKFCLFRVRVTDANGANERYYWVGDSNTGSFTYARQWTEDNFKNNKGKGRYGEYCDAVWTINDENIDVWFNVTSVYDQARFEINLVNNSTSSKYCSLAMYGTPATSDNPSGNWGLNTYYHYKANYKETTLLGWDVDNRECDCESDPCYFFIPGVGTINEGTVFSGDAVADRLEMYAYRYNNTNYQDLEKSRRDDTTLKEENAEQTYMLPPQSSWIEKNLDEHGVPTRTQGESTALQSVAQATFDNDGDATKPNYLIIDFSSNMLSIDNSDPRHHYPFGQFLENNTRTIDSGAFPDNTLWPSGEKNVATPYEDSLASSNSYGYVDQHQDPLSYMAVWGSKLVKAKGSRQIITYYGLGGKSFINGYMSNTTFNRQNHALLVSSPAVLGYQVTKDEVGNDTLKPNSFYIHTEITNQGHERHYYDFKVNQVRIKLPDGLELGDDDDGDDGTWQEYDYQEDGYTIYYTDKSITLGQLGVYDSISMNVVANGEYSGALEYQVIIEGQDTSGGSSWTQTVSRSILVPATKTGWYYGATGNLLGNPFKNVTSDGFDGSNPFTVTGVYGSDVYSYTWDAQNQEYVAFNDLNELKTNPQGYWVLKGSDEDSDNTYQYEFPSYTKPNDLNYGDIDAAKYYMSELSIPVYKEWNIISNPYIYPMQWCNVAVKNVDTGDVKSMTDAIDAGWIYKNIFSWEPAKDDSGSMDPEKSKYLPQNTVSTLLIPTRGYWIYSTKNLMLYFKPMLYPDSKIYDDDYYTDPDAYFRLGYTTDENYK